MTAILAALDTETTGLLSPDHRIIEVYVELIRDRKTIFAYNQRIDPERSISLEAQRVHKIAYSDLVGQPKWDAVAPTLHKVLSKATHFMAHNSEFDLDFLAQEFTRIGLDLPHRPVIDTMKQGIWATPDGKSPNLSELCFACGVPYDASLAHAADYDVKRMVECYHAGAAWGFFPDVFALESAQAA